MLVLLKYGAIYIIVITSQEFEQTFIKSAMDLCEKRACSLVESIKAAKSSTDETVTKSK